MRRPTPRHTAFRPARLFAAALVCCAAGASCSGEDDAKEGTASGADATTAGTNDALVGDSEDAITASSCLGVADDNRALFSQYDDQCTFLSDCPQTGQCYCGDGCKAEKTKCQESLCAGIDSTCWCGDTCASQHPDKPMCPQYVCNDKGDISGCAAQTGCTYIGQDREEKCKCTTMANAEPDCWCGASCSGDKAACNPALCVGKNADKCIIVPGTAYTGCYCATCGLLGDQPRCFFVVCP